VVLRPFNTFGPRQSYRAVIPTILGQILAGLDEIHLGSLEPRRDFTFVTDTVEGFVAAASADLELGAVVQLGTGRAVSVGELATIACAALGHDAEVVADPDRVRPATSEVEHLLSDPTRAARQLGWSPRTSLEEGLALTAEWLRPRIDLDRVRRYHR
jgi:UDP-glucose 4-epimerase